jgi:dihydrofolate reductase
MTMGKLIVFNSVSLDGYFTDANGGMSWAHRDDADGEWNSFVAGNARGDCAMVFGRITYEMMAGWWPTPQATTSMPVVAERMNLAPKTVFSRTLDHAAWNNTTVADGDLAATVRTMKAVAGPDIMIFGSGSIVSQLAQEGLIDEFQLVLIPVVLGKGRTMFDGVTQPPKLKLTKARTFPNGNVFLCYEPDGGDVAKYPVRVADIELTPKAEAKIASKLPRAEQLARFEKDLEAHDGGNQPA